MKKLYYLGAITIIIGISLFACSKLFSSYFYTSQDGPGHLIRMIEFHEAVNDGQIPVRIAKRINFGLGYPFFTFNYPLVYYAGDGLQRLGLSVLQSFKAVLIGATILSGVSFFAWLYPYAGTLAALVGSIFWVIAPYKFLNMYVRGNVAEYFGLAMVSLGLLVVGRYLHKKLNAYAVIVYFALFLLSHNITVLIGLPLLLLYAGWATRLFGIEKNRFWKLCALLIPALGMTAFFWYPAFVETPLTKLAELRSDYTTYFPTLGDMMYSPWGFGSFARDSIPGKMSVQLGLIHLFALGVGMVLLATRWGMKKMVLQPMDTLGLFFALLIPLWVMVTLQLSQPVWDAIPLLQYVQIPWRFMGYLTLSASVLAAYVVWRLPRGATLIGACTLTLFLVYANRNHIRVNQYIPFENPFAIAQIYGPSTTSKDEHMPLWAPHIYETPNQQGDIVPLAAGTSQRTDWKSNLHVFTVTVVSDAEFRDNTSYFPGWTATVDGRSVPIRYRDDPFGRLRISLSQGTHEVRFAFGEPAYRKAADTVTVVSAILFILFWLRSVWLRRVGQIGILGKDKKRVDPGHHRGSVRKKGES